MWSWKHYNCVVTNIHVDTNANNYENRLIFDESYLQNRATFIGSVYTDCRSTGSIYALVFTSMTKMVQPSLFCWSQLLSGKPICHIYQSELLGLNLWQLISLQTRSVLRAYWPLCGMQRFDSNVKHLPWSLYKLHETRIKIHASIIHCVRINKCTSKSQLSHIETIRYIPQT